ncbi:hypothetical protein HaLaN_21849 [Haematococcus lacustris]|uniref:Uncharacterized protein n=1 Tax=Haematococcus lacustris TaxID=44745 RepID=A0A699ZWY6_HAELA|nr:hypothetical protein HaLaN_21849 [Haematococcus lacustris]
MEALVRDKGADPSVAASDAAQHPHLCAACTCKLPHLPSICLVRPSVTRHPFPVVQNPVRAPPISSCVGGAIEGDSCFYNEEAGLGWIQTSIQNRKQHGNWTKGEGGRQNRKNRKLGVKEGAANR